MYENKRYIKNILFNHPIMNASGCHCTSKKDLLQLRECYSSAVVSKSSTISFRSGNERPRYYNNKLLSINSTGLANNGYKFYNELGKEIKNNARNL